MKNDSRDVPAFDRLNYYYGQVLGPAELRLEQDYVRNKLRLLNRCLHGSGIVCGFEVVAVEPPADCAPDDPAPPPARVCVTPGIALDGDGRELVLRDPIELELWSMLSPADQRVVVDHGAASLYLSVCYCERSLDPGRPAIPDACGAALGCRDGKTREEIRFVVSVRPPERGAGCDGCCGGGCGEPCLLLARIGRFVTGQPLAPHAIDLGVRRAIGRHDYATITELGWAHGATYTPEQAHHLLGHHGVRVQFSRKVRRSTLVPGVFDLMVIEDNDNRLADTQSITADIVIPGDPDAEYTDVVYYKQRSHEYLQVGDRVVFTLRAAFVLDECCEPVDGEHVGGRVPYRPEPCDACHHPHHHEPPHGCRHPPSRTGRWRSGNGAGGGTFETWIFVGGDPEHDAPRGHRGRRQP